MTVVLLVAGLILLVVGAEALVRGASGLARAMGVSPIVIGLTIVAFGTSSPEMAVSVQTALAGKADIALGNVVGSNIFNVLFILGLSALVTPLVVHQRLVRLDVPLMIGVSFLLLLLSLDGSLGKLDGALLFGGIIAYTFYAIWESRRETRQVREEYEKEFGAPAEEAPGGASIVWQLVLVVAGLGMLVLGSQWLVDAAVSVARALGVSELVIGLTLVAAGTSLPEVATSVMASIRGERDIAVGNVVGSNIFNILSVLGLATLASPTAIEVSEVARHVDIPVMIAVALACLPIFFSGIISRRMGALFLFYYVAYTLYLILQATGSTLLGPFVSIILLVAIPLTVLVLAALTITTLPAPAEQP